MSCEFCGGDAFTSHQVLEMMFGTREPFEYRECTSCGCIKRHSQPGDLSRYYPADGYYAHTFRLDARARVRRALLRLAVRYPRSRKLLSRVVPMQTVDFIQSFGLERGMRILDVGSGVGRLIRDLRSAGFRNAVGIDPFIGSDLQDDYGVVVRKIDLNQADGGWDRIMFHHSFEHVDNPVETLRIVGSRLAPGGMCIIRIPVANWAWRQYGANWVQLDAPRHAYLHTEKSLGMAAQQAGLRMVESRYDSTDFQFWGSELYVRNIPLQKASANLTEYFSRDQLQEFRRRAEDLNRKRLGDQAMFFFACRG